MRAGPTTITLFVGVAIFDGQICASGLERRDVMGSISNRISCCRCLLDSLSRSVLGTRGDRLRNSDEGSGVNRNRIMSPSLSLMRLPRRHYLRLGAAPLLFFFCVSLYSA